MLDGDPMGPQWGRLAARGRAEGAGPDRVFMGAGAFCEPCGARHSFCSSQPPQPSQPCSKPKMRRGSPGDTGERRGWALPVPGSRLPPPPQSTGGAGEGGNAGFQDGAGTGFLVTFHGSPLFKLESLGWDRGVCLQVSLPLPVRSRCVGTGREWGVDTQAPRSLEEPLALLPRPSRPLPFALLSPRGARAWGPSTDCKWVMRLGVPHSPTQEREEFWVFIRSLGCSAGQPLRELTLPVDPRAALCVQVVPVPAGSQGGAPRCLARDL